MPYEAFPDGLYLLAQNLDSKGLEHYGILDVGNRIGNPTIGGRRAVIIHQAPPALRVDWANLTGPWRVLGRIADEAAALFRLRIAAANPKYDLFGNNCEHFARFVATGKRESVQLQTAGVVAGLVALFIWLSGQP